MAIYTIYAVCTCLILYGTANMWLMVPMQAFLVIIWMSVIAQLKTFTFRANLCAILLEISITCYALSVDRVQEVLTSCIGLVIVLGLYEMPKLLWLSVASNVIICLWHIFYRKSFDFSNWISTLRSLLEILAVFLATWVVHFLVSEEEKSKFRLLDSIEELKVTQQSKDDFLANVSHELRTPINTICGMSEIALRDNVPPSMEEHLHNIQSAGKNLLSVVTDILDFSELQSGKMELIEETYNITSVVNDIVNMSMPRVSSKKLDFLVDIDANTPSGLKGDEQKIRRVVMSLVDNAIKFTDKGCVVFKIGFRKEEYGINLCITIKDTGIGMRQESLSRIFVGFSQINSQRNRQESGIGLGLSIAQAIVELMGGFITVNSQYGKGTEVQFVIPQTVVDDTPIARIEGADECVFAAYVNMERFRAEGSRDSYKNTIVSMASMLGVKSYICMSLRDIKRRVTDDSLTHIFLGIEEYLEDRDYFNELAKKIGVIVFLSSGDENKIDSDSIARVYRPMYVIPVVNAVNDMRRIGDRVVYEHTRERFAAPDAHILVVDDSFMNVRVLEGLLKPYQIKITTASSGKEALEKIESKNFDFVFMDHMMPEMDGIECTHRIRAMDNLYYKNLPIIALTANAVAGMREMFLKESFNDFLAKPVEISGLERVLKKFVPASKIKFIEEETIDAKPLTETEQTKEESSQELVIGDLDVKKGLTYCGSKENYIDILKMHVENGARNLSDIQSLYDKQDWKNYTILVHALKSSMKSIGADALSEMARLLEAAGKEDNIDYITANHDAMATEYSRVTQMLCECELLSVTKKEEVKVDSLRELSDAEFDNLIKEFENAAYTFEAKYMNKVLEELDGCKYNSHTLSSELVTIHHKIEMSDYMSALDAIMALRDQCKSTEGEV